MIDLSVVVPDSPELGRLGELDHRTTAMAREPPYRELAIVEHGGSYRTHDSLFALIDEDPARPIVTLPRNIRLSRSFEKNQVKQVFNSQEVSWHPGDGI